LVNYGCNVAKAFQKVEALKTAQAARNITVAPDGVKWAGSRYMYALSEKLKTLEWYTFGKDPITISERLATLYSDAQICCDGDFTNMDGTIGWIQRELDNQLFHKMFHPSYHAELDAVVLSLYGNRVTTRHGVSYDQGCSQASGFPDTVLNTVRNAFIAYLAGTYSGLSPFESWAALGLYGGDDGSTPDANADNLLRAANDVGQRLKLDVIRRGNPVPFLGRLYFPWGGSQNSMCDVVRQLNKLHITTRSIDTPNAIVARDKGLSGLVMDANTPLIGVVYKKLANAAALGGEDVMYTYSAFQALGRNAVNVHEAWMDDVIAAAYDAEQIDQIVSWAVGPGHWANPPTVQHKEIVVKVASAEIDGAIHNSPVVELEEGEIPPEPVVPPTPVKPPRVSFGDIDFSNLPKFTFSSPSDKSNKPKDANKKKMTPEEYKAYVDRTYTPEEQRKHRANRRAKTAPAQPDVKSGPGQ
jgi:hypothetical protein